MDNLIEIRVVEGFLEGEIIKAKLESFNIPCMLKEESARRLFGLTLNGLGKVRVMIPKGYEGKAEELLKEL